MVTPPNLSQHFLHSSGSLLAHGRHRSGRGEIIYKSPRLFRQPLGRSRMCVLPAHGLLGGWYPALRSPVVARIDVTRSVLSERGVDLVKELVRKGEIAEFGHVDRLTV
jgi:hypothetical protein